MCGVTFTFHDLEMVFTVTVIYLMLLDMLHYYYDRYKLLLTSKGRRWVEMHVYLWLFRSLWWLRSNDPCEITRRTLWILSHDVNDRMKVKLYPYMDDNYRRWGVRVSLFVRRRDKRPRHIRCHSLWQQKLDKDDVTLKYTPEYWLRLEEARKRRRVFGTLDEGDDNTYCKFCEARSFGSLR